MRKLLLGILLVAQLGVAQKEKFEFGMVRGYNSASVSSIQEPCQKEVSARAGANIVF